MRNSAIEFTATRFEGLPRLDFDYAPVSGGFEQHSSLVAGETTDAVRIVGARGNLQHQGWSQILAIAEHRPGRERPNPQRAGIESRG